MKKTVAIFLFVLSLAFANAFAQERIIDTVYTDSHRVMYITNSSSSDAWATGPNYYKPQAETQEDTLGLSAPPNKDHRASLLLIAQSLSFTLHYEYLFADFWSASLRFGYAGFDKTDVKKNTDAEGTIYTFAVPVAMRWYWGRRNLGKYHYVDAGGNNVRRNKSQVEGYLQAQIVPIHYSVDLHRDSSSYKEKLILKEKENALYYTLGLGFNFLYERFFFGTEINIGSFITNPKFQDHVAIYRNKYGTRLLEKYIAESILSVGVSF